MTTQSQAPDTNMGENYEGPTPTQPVHPSVEPHLDQQYLAFHNKHNLYTPYIQDIPWSPSIRNAPTVPGGQAPVAVESTKDFDLDGFQIRAFLPFGHQASQGKTWPVFIWYHGGGMVLGSINAENGACSRICVAAECVVIAVDYRLAPEHKFPQGHDDAWSAYCWVLEDGSEELKVDTSRFGIGGSSSGGNLALSVAQRAGTEKKPLSFLAVSVPVCDNTAEGSRYPSWETNQYCPGLPAPKMLWYRKQYLSDADLSSTLASPILASDEVFTSMVSRVYIAVAELDLLCSEGDALATKLQKFGKNVTLKTYPSVPHLVMAMDAVVDTARVMIKDLCAEVASNFGRHPGEVSMMDLYPDGFEAGVPQIQGGDPWYKLDTPMVLGEAPMYRASDSTLHYNDCLHDPAEWHILKLDPKTGDAVGKPRIFNLEDSVTVAAFREGKPGYIVAYFQGVAFMDEQTGKLEVVKEIIPTEDRDIRRFNDGGVDCQGRFWLAEIDRKSLAAGWGKSPADYQPIGRLWRYDPDGSLHQMETGLMCGNGLAWSPDNKTMYLNDSVAGLIWAYDFDIPSGNISNKRLFIDRRVFGGEPDGMVCDVEGNLWIAVWGSYRVMVFSSTGKHLKDIVFTAKNMACTSWGGPNYDTLYIASASDRTARRRVDDQGGHLFRYHVGVKGLPKYEFKG